MAACLGIVLDPETNTMKVFGGEETEMVSKSEADDSICHRDDILCLDVSADRKTVVTGQMGKSPTVHIWDAVTGKSRSNFKLEEGSRGVGAVGISPCGRYVAIADMHSNHRIVLHNIVKNKTLFTLDGGKEGIVNIAWSKKLGDLRFCTIGTQEVKFWNPNDSSKRLFVRGTCGNKNQITYFQCGVYDEEGLAYTGGANGSIYVWDMDH